MEAESIYDSAPLAIRLLSAALIAKEIDHEGRC